VDRLAALRKAFMATMKDEAFLADAKRLQLDIDPSPAEEVVAIIEKMYKSQPEAIAKLRDIMKPQK
jgi:hypothetical protein